MSLPCPRCAHANLDGMRFRCRVRCAAHAHLRELRPRESPERGLLRKVRDTARSVRRNPGERGAAHARHRLVEHHRRAAATHGHVLRPRRARRLLSEQIDPEELCEVVRAYQETCGAVIRAFDGHVARYLGDGILAYFGYPQAHEDDAARGVSAALAILEQLPLNARVVGTSAMLAFPLTCASGSTPARS